MSSNNIFVRNGLQKNHWVWHSVMKAVDDMLIQNRKSMKEINDESSGNF